MKNRIAMIPARLGSQRLKQKNLSLLGGVPLITRAIRKCVEAGVFDEIWVNSESDVFGDIARQEGVAFHKRPAELADNNATSEDFIYEFLKNHPCGELFQVHSIAPLLTAAEVAAFVNAMDGFDTLLCYVPEQIECALDGVPVNFTFSEKTNSQLLKPVQRITWSITGWRGQTYVAAYERGETATYSGRVGFSPISRAGGHIIKTQEDLDFAAALLGNTTG